jgi:RNA polymerase sigma factor (TIGR02999 family)
MSDNEPAVTGLLQAWRQGETAALDQLTEVVYADLRNLAARRLSGERRNHTLQPTELVHETFLRLLDADVELQDRTHFFAVAARAMRRVLIDYARARGREKRGSGAVRVTLGDLHASTPPHSVDIVALDRALDELARLDPEQSRMIELYHFGGLTLEEIAAATSRSRSTVHRLVRSGQAWLFLHLDTATSRVPGP